MQSHRETLARTEQLVVNGKFKDAIRLADSLSSASDYRYRELAGEAKQLADRYRDELGEWQTKLDKIPNKLEKYLGRQDYKRAIALLSPIPAGLLSDDFQATLADCEHKAKLGREAKTSFKAALSAKDWTTAMVDLNQILDLYPNNEKYLGFVEQVIAKIARSARRLKEAGKYADAYSALQTIPIKYQTSSHKNTCGELEEMIFLRKYIAVAPLCDPLVGAILDKLQNLTPDDRRVEKLAEKFKSKRRRRPKVSHAIYPQWMKAHEALFSDPILPSTLPSSVQGSRPACVNQAGGRFWTAFGLALHGLGCAPSEASFQRSAKSGLFSLGRKKQSATDVCWGMDVGDSSIKAIRICLKDGVPVIEDAFVSNIDSESKVGSRRPSQQTVFRALENCIDGAKLGDVPVVANLAGTDLLSRYMDLPAQSPKQHGAFVEQEAQANIPINAELLSKSYYVSEVESEASVSQRTVLLATKKSEVEAKLSMWERLDVNLHSLVAEPFACFTALKSVNFLDLPESEESKSTLLFLDIGHVSSTIMLARRDGFWFRSIDWGLDDLSHAIAKETKVSLADASGVRRSPKAGGSLVAIYNILASASTVPKREMKRSIEAAKKHMGDFEVASAVITGGGAYQPLLASLLNDEQF